MVSPMAVMSAMSMAAPAPPAMAPASIMSSCRRLTRGPSGEPRHCVSSRERMNTAWPGREKMID